jgi:phage terminase large subunit-like protein
MDVRSQPQKTTKKYSSLARLLRAEGIEPQEFRQGYKSVRPVVHNLKVLINSGTCWHSGNPVMNSMLECNRLKTDGNLFKPDLATSGELCGPLSLIMAASALLGTCERAASA